MIFAFIKYSPSFYNNWEGGNFNGYVGFPSELYPQADDIIEDEISNRINIHGGVSFNDYMGYFKDIPILPMTNLPNINELYTKKYRVIGFDTFHDNDTKDNWPLAKVKTETWKMYNQVIEILKERVINDLINK